MPKTGTKTKTIWKILPVVAAAMVLGGCGGGDGDDEGGSITACFTANKEVNYSRVTMNAPQGQYYTIRSNFKSTTYNGQPVSALTSFYPAGLNITKNTIYWQVTNNGVTELGSVADNGPLDPDGTFWSVNTKPGKTAADTNGNVSTFIGFENVVLAGKTFPNTCHFKIAGTFDGKTNIGEAWYAPGYGMIKQNISGVINQYSGDL